MIPIQGMQTSGTLRENPLSPYEQAQRETEEMLDEKYKDPEVFTQEQEGLKQALGGIGEIDPETGKQIAESALNLEEVEAGEENLDTLLAGLDEEDLIIGTEGNDTIGINSLGEGENIVLANIGEDKLHIETLQAQEEVQRERDEHIMTPSVRHLQEADIITPEQSLDLQNYFVENGSIDDIGTLESFQGNNELIQEVKDYLGNMTSNEDAALDGLKNFTKDFGEEMKLPRDSKGNVIQGRDQEAFDTIGSHYHLLGLEDTVRDKNLAFNAAIGSAYNMLIDGKQFKRTVEFEKLSHTIHNANLQKLERFDAYKSLLDIVDTSQALGGKKQETAFLKRTAEAKLATIGKYNEFMERITRFREAEENSNEQIEIAQELEMIRAEGELTPAEASLLAGGELDVGSDIAEEGGETV